MPEIKLIHGDCMDYMKDLPDKAFDLAIVDPPYGIAADKTQNAIAESGRVSNGGKWKKYTQTNWDSTPPNEFYFSELERVSRNQIIWGGNYYTVNLSGVIVWYKGKNGTMKDGEFAKTNINTFKVFELSRIDAYVNNDQVKSHPTQKPVALYEWLLKNYAKKGDRILDTHGGSMGIAIACYNLDFDLTLFEVDKDYFEAGEKRLEEHKKQARLFDK